MFHYFGLLLVSGVPAPNFFRTTPVAGQGHSQEFTIGRQPGDMGDESTPTVSRGIAPVRAWGGKAYRSRRHVHVDSAETKDTKQMHFSLLLPVYWLIEKFTYDYGGHAPMSASSYAPAPWCCTAVLCCAAHSTSMSIVDFDSQLLSLPP